MPTLGQFLDTLDSFRHLVFGLFLVLSAFWPFVLRTKLYMGGIPLMPI